MGRVRTLLIGLLTALAVGITGAQEAKKGEQKPGANDPEPVVSDEAIRIQPMDRDERGRWIVMPGYDELGSPCFSRDGRWVAFDAYMEGYNNGRPEAWIARSDGTDAKKLTNGATPRWSPDGKQLLFIRGSEVEAKGEPSIYIIKADGTKERKFRPGRWPEWSPDGKKIAFSRGGLPGGGAKVGAEVFTSNADGSHEKFVAEGDCPSWSPDGKRLACCFRQEGAPPQIRVLDLESGDATTIGDGWFRANWMPDGKAVVANGFFGQVGMVKLAVAGRALAARPMFTEFEDAASPSPSPDGRFLVFTARRARKAGGP